MILAVPLLAGALVAAQPHPADSGPPDWLLPNFAERLELDVINPSTARVRTLAAVPVAQASSVALRFPGTLAIVVRPGSPPAVLPSQIDDLDGDGTPDEIVFPVDLEAGASARVHVYFSRTLRDELPWPKRAHASHAFGYNHATATLESELIGYRTYGGFFLDVQARHDGQPGLFNALVGYLGSRHRSPAGRDVIHLGDTLGLGGLFLRHGREVLRPPLNVPDYAHAPSPPDVPRYRIVASGPLRAIVEARLDRWQLNEAEQVAVRATYTITAGATHVECRFQVVPRHIVRHYEVGAGVRHLPDMTVDHAAGRLALSGTESPEVGPLGLALYYDSSSAAAAPPMATKEAANEVVLFRQALAPGRLVEGRYWLAAAWRGTGIRDLLPHLRRVEPQARAAVRIEALRLARTPWPERVEGEAH